MNERYKEVTCPICGKVFYPEYLCNWSWKTGAEPNLKLVCSYTCQRKGEKNVKKLNPKRKRVPVRIVETGETFESITECADHLNADRSNIFNSVYKSKTYNGLHIERVEQL